MTRSTASPGPIPTKHRDLGVVRLAVEVLILLKGQSTAIERLFFIKRVLTPFWGFDQSNQANYVQVNSLIMRWIFKVEIGICKRSLYYDGCLFDLPVVKNEQVSGTEVAPLVAKQLPNISCSAQIEKIILLTNCCQKP